MTATDAKNPTIRYMNTQVKTEIIVVLLGYYMASIPGLQTEEAVMNKVKEYSGEIGLVFFALALFVVLYLIYKGYKKK